MSQEAIKVGFIGAGSICRDRHLPGLARIDGVRVVAICNRSEQSSRNIVDAFEIPHVEKDWRKLIARDDLDAVFIGTWPYMHCRMSIAVLEAGKHCFCQARMAMDLQEARQMLAAAEAHPKLVNMICPPPTRMPFEPYIKHMIDSDKLGSITAVHLQSAHGGNLDPGDVHWRQRIEYSGKQILEVGIYAETLNSFVGPYESLTAQLATPIASKTDASASRVAIKVPQVVIVSGKMACGALGCEYHSGLASDTTTPGCCLTIWGLKGTLCYNFGDTIAFARAGQPLETVDVPQELRRGWQVEQDFIQAVRSARAGRSWSVSPDFAEGLAYMCKVEAVHQSAATGQAVTLASL